MSDPQIADRYHLSLTIDQTLWPALTSAALPYKVGEGRFELGKALYQGVKQLQVKEKVVALLEDQSGRSELVGKARRRAGDLWHARREQVYGVLEQVLQVEGDWKVEVDREGTDLTYGQQRLSADATVKAVASGKAYLLGRNIELPFVLEKRLGASCTFGDIRFDKSADAIVGSVQDPRIHLGEHVVLRLLDELGNYILAQQVDRLPQHPIIKKGAVEDMVGPAGGALNLVLGVEDVALVINEDAVTLKVRFGFTQKQIEG